MRLLPLIAFSMAFTAIACTDPERRPIGATCGDDAQCASGLCLDNQCVDPAGDEDRDGLTNGVEAALGTDAFIADTDLDGKGDATERGTGSTPTDTDGDGLPDALESAIDDTDGDCIPDELDPEDAGLDPSGCAPGDTTSPDTSDTSDSTDSTTSDIADTTTSDTAQLDADPTDSDTAQLDADSTDTADLGPTDTEDTTDIGPEPTARCDAPVLVMSESLGHYFVSPASAGGNGSQTVVTFADGNRNHYALRLGHFGWVGPELMVSGVDTNTGMEPFPVSATDRLVAFRADQVDSGNGILALYSWRTEEWSTTAGRPGFGSYAGAHAVLDDETLLAAAFVGGAQGLELFRWDRSNGFGTPTTLAPYANERVFDTTLLVSGEGDGVVLAYLNETMLIDAYPLQGGAPYATSARLRPTGAQDIDSDFRAVRLANGDLVAVWSEGRAIRLVSAVFRVVDGAGLWSEPQVIVDAWAGRPSLGVDARGRVIAIHTLEAGDHWIAREPDGTWSEPRPLNTRSNHRWDLVTDTAGFTWTSWTTEDGTVEILRFSPTTDSWTVADRIGREPDELSRDRAITTLTPDGGAMVLWDSNIGESERVSAATCR